MGSWAITLFIAVDKIGSRCCPGDFGRDLCSILQSTRNRIQLVFSRGVQNWCVLVTATGINMSMASSRQVFQGLRTTSATTLGICLESERMTSSTAHQVASSSALPTGTLKIENNVSHFLRR